jgi:hypothetical protein
VVVWALNLGLRGRGDAVLEEPAGTGQRGCAGSRDSTVGIGTNHQRCVFVEAHRAPALIVVELFVNLDVLTTEVARSSRLKAVQRDLPILLLQAEAYALRDEGDYRADEEEHLEYVDDALDGDEVRWPSGPSFAAAQSIA